MQQPPPAPHGHAEMPPMTLDTTRARSSKHSEIRTMMCLRMLQPGVTSAIAASQTVRPARIQQSMSSTMFVARDHHQQRRSRTNSPMIGSSVRTTPNAVAALVGLAVVMKTTRTMRALAVATQSGSHALLTVGARVLRIAVAATGDCAPLHTGEPLSQSVGPRPAGGIWGSLCIRCRSSQCSPLRSTPPGRSC